MSAAELKPEAQATAPTALPLRAGNAADYGKIAIHPEPRHTLSEMWTRAASGPVPGQLVVMAGIVFRAA